MFSSLMTRRPKKGKKRVKIATQSISKLMKEADRLFSIIVRNKESYVRSEDKEVVNTCYTCGHVAPIKKLHCGHYLSRFYKAARWDFDNARPQCSMCNMWKRGDPITFRAKLISEIGEARVKAVEEKRTQTTKLRPKDLLDLIEKLKMLASAPK